MTVMEFIGPLLTEDQTRAMMERSRESWGSGYATEGALAVKDYAFAELGLTEIVSFTSEVNLRSRRVMEKIGLHRNPTDDFDHPSISEGNLLRRNVLYRKLNISHS